VLAPALLAYPLAIDAVLVAGIGRKSPDVALQMGLIGMQSFLAAALLTDATKNLVARARPDAAECVQGTEDACVQQNESFFSGHTAFAFTGAGLICAQHQALPLYGEGAWGAVACAASLLAASAVGTLRIVADRHYVSDVLSGAAVGLAAGYLLPNLMHYEFGSNRAHSARISLLRERGLFGLAYVRTF
jgi:membrane-associated phospholipid phosphatase